jgi:Flp pilus assembly pilin Flp
MKRLLTAFWRDESASPTTEYAILAALIAMAVIAAVALFGNEVLSYYETTQEKFPDVGGS